MSVQSTGLNVTPSQKKQALTTNYLGSADFDFLKTELPDLYEKEFEKYGDRTVSGFLRQMSAEIATNSDLIKWTEQGRLHIKYTAVTTGASAGDDTADFTVTDAGVTEALVRVGQTIHVSDSSGNENKAIVTAVKVGGDDLVFSVAFYEAAGLACSGNMTVFIYGSEFKKGTTGMEGSIEAQEEIHDNNPIILKDHYEINGSDMAQIGWIEVATEEGASGYMWYVKSKSETRLRFDDYLETSLIEAKKAEANSGAAAQNLKGTEGLFEAIETRGNVWDGGNPDSVADFDAIVARLDKQGAIEENALFLNRQFGFDIDDMLADLSKGDQGGTSYGLFDNDSQMALNLGFTGFRRGYDFYKSDWKYLNDPMMRGGITGGVNGLLVPAGTTTVYDNVLGKNAKRPFLHVRYRAAQGEDRKYKTYTLGSAGGAQTSSLDALQVEFLSERALCTLGTNNFFLFKGTQS